MVDNLFNMIMKKAVVVNIVKRPEKIAAFERGRYIRL